MKINKKILRIFLTLFIVALSVTVMFMSVLTTIAETKNFAGGSGTETDPYLISTKEHLNNVRNDLDAHYKMIADIVFTEADFAEGGAFYNDGQGWMPIGKSTTHSFTGSFDGNNKTIKGLFINITTSDITYAGLFGCCNGGNITNLTMGGGNIEIVGATEVYVGGICAYSPHTNFDNCYNTNNLKAIVRAESTGVQPYSYIGGISGYGGNCTNCENKGDIITEVKEYNADYDFAYCGGIVGGGGYAGAISNCTNYGNISAASTSTWTAACVDAGGIAGSTSKMISNCKNYGNISCSANNMTSVYAGGICGSFSGGTLEMSYNAGTIIGPHAAGIAGGLYHSTISNCYNLGEITSSDYAGGIVGYVTYNGEINSCYNVGIINGSDNFVYIGGIIGYMSSGISSDCYFGDNVSNGTGRGNSLTAKKSAEEMQLSSTFTGFDFENLWELSEGNAYLYPTLRENSYYLINENSEFQGGDGSEDFPYLIATPKHLNNVRKYLESHFKLVRDILFTDADFAEGGDFYNNGQGWIPIGTDYNSPFTGHFEGNNYQISNLYMNITEVPKNCQVFAGLFGYGDGCQISNLILNNSNIAVDVKDAFLSVGAFIGSTDSYGSGAVITNCINNGKIYASTSNGSYVGGIAGSFEKGTITGCKNYGSIDTSSAGAGGIIGYLNQGTITECQNYGSIESKSNSVGCGGIVALTFGNTVSCSNYGNITSSFNAGGIVNSNWGLIDNCRNDGKITAKYSAGGIASVSAAEQNGDKTCGIKNCINYGLVTSGIASDDMYGISAGGIAGRIQNGITISNSRNCADVLSQTELGYGCYSGGIVGYNSGGYIFECSNIGNVTVITEWSACGGGIVGGNCGGDIPVVVDQCVNQGEICAPVGDNGACGGIAGSNFDTATISNCFNIGSVTSSSRPGGIIGLADSSSVRAIQCYNIGTLTTLTPNQWIGGSNANITNCFYLDKENYTSTVITGYAYGAALNPAEMTNSKNFSGFDFDSIWTMDGNSDYPYPELQSVRLSYSKELQDVVVYKLPIKTIYLEGKDSFDITGGKILLVYNYEVREIVDMTIDMISGYDNTKVGTQELTIEHIGCKTTFKVMVNAKSLTSIKVTKNPTKMIYWEGDEFNASGMAVTAYYNNDTSAIITNYTISGYSSTPGTKTITVSYDGKTTTFKVTVNAKSLTSIKVTKNPTKMTYLEGESFSKSGMVITAYYNNNTSATITNYTVNGYSSTPGTKTITVSYDGKTTTFKVTVNAKSLTSIKVTKNPTKMIYWEGDEFNASGMAVTAYYNNDTSAIITNYTISGYSSTPGTKTITVSYDGKTTTFKVTVNAKSLTSIKVTKNPTKMTYLEGESFSKSGMMVTAYYNNNTSATITNFTVSSNFSTPGTKTVTVSCGGKSVSFTVTVNSRVPSSITSNKHTVSSGNIGKITVGTPINTLLTNLNEGVFCKVYSGNKEVAKDKPIGTGMVIKIMDGTKVKASYTAIVTGDTNGDGGISITDMISVKAHLLKKSNLSGVYATAADTNGDKGISITDFIQIKAQILKKGDIIAR